VLKIPIVKAEDIKKEVDIFSDDDEEQQQQDDLLEFDHMGKNYSYSLIKLTEIVQDRVDELFASLVRTEIANSGVSMLPAGLIITGGVARSAGLDKYLSKVLDMPVRISSPLDASRMPPNKNGPEYTCAAGIIRYALEQERDPYRYIEQSLDFITTKPPVRDHNQQPSVGGTKPQDKSLLNSVLDVIKELFY
jgi:cell division protein FtsA